MNFALAMPIPEQLLPLPVFTQQPMRRIHFDQCSVETICGGGPPIVNPQTPLPQHHQHQCAPHLSPRSPLQAAVARKHGLTHPHGLQDNTDSHTLMVHGRPTTTHSSTTVVHHDRPIHLALTKTHQHPQRVVHLQPPFNRCTKSWRSSGTLEWPPHPGFRHSTVRHKSLIDQRPTPTPPQGHPPASRTAQR